MPEVLFLYGKSLCSEYQREISKPTPLIPLSASYEIPNRELIDPVGQTWRRKHFSSARFFHYRKQDRAI